MAASSVRQVHAILRRALGQGVKWGWLPANPAALSSPPKVVQQDVRPPSPEEVAKFINAAWAADPDFGTLPRVASYAIRIDANAGNVGEWLVEQDAEVAVGDSARLEVLAAGVGTKPQHWRSLGPDTAGTRLPGRCGGVPSSSELAEVDSYQRAAETFTADG